MTKKRVFRVEVYHTAKPDEVHEYRAALLEKVGETKTQTKWNLLASYVYVDTKDQPLKIAKAQANNMANTMIDIMRACGLTVITEIQLEKKAPSS